MMHCQPEDPCSLTPEEEDLILLFRQLTEPEQQQALDCLRDQLG